MKKVIAAENVPIKMWSNTIDDNALDQARNVANLPFVFKHVALQADCHLGFGVPIGCVFATNNVVIPNAAGKDLGCGMCFVRTDKMADDITREGYLAIAEKRDSLIPTGFAGHDAKQCPMGLEDMVDDNMPVVKANFEPSLYKLGTLGGGNHFIELQRDEDGYLCVMIHSGSRNIGSKVADWYDKIAKDLNAKWYSSVPKEHDLAFLPLNTPEAKSYMKEMQFCVEYAFQNRMFMMDVVKDVLDDYLGDIQYQPAFDIAHMVLDGYLVVNKRRKN